MRRRLGLRCFWQLVFGEAPGLNRHAASVAADIDGHFDQTRTACGARRRRLHGELGTRALTNQRA